MEDRIRELVERLNAAAVVYYGGGEVMSDFEYDRLYDELAELEGVSGIVLPDSPTQRIGAGVEAFQTVESLVKVAHEVPMLSLDKTKEIERLKKFLGENEGLLSVKLDGLAIALTYENGRLVQAITRGNGEVGENVTHNALVFKNLPKQIDFAGKLIVKGEAVISFEQFERINANGQYKNPRNLTAGTVRQLNSEICAERGVEFFAVGCNAEAARKSDDLQWLEGLGIKVTPNKIVYANTVEQAAEEFRAQIVNGSYAADGLVLTYNDKTFSRSLGVTTKFPRDSIAYKWADETSETTLIDIEWSVSRTGLINPVAVFEPVEIEGTTVERASVHNVSIVEALGLGVGDRIEVYKANMIIPQIALNNTRSGGLPPPLECPACGAETVVKETENVKTLHCENPLCAAQVRSRIVHFASRTAMNIEGLSVQTIEKFIQQGFIADYTDLYKLERYEQEIKELHGFGEKSYNALIRAVESSKKCRLANFIYALGINHVGLANARLLCKRFGGYEEIKEADIDELLGIPGFGEAIAAAVAEFFRSDEAKKADEVFGFLSIEPEPIKKTEGKFSGKAFVLTGDTSRFKNRAELQEFIEGHGGKVVSAVSKKTDYLVNNDVNSLSGKNKKAKELGVEIIGEEMLLVMADLT